MPTDKRARQKEGRAARQQALLEQQRRAGRRRRIFRFFIPVAVLSIAAVLLSNRGGNDNTSVKAAAGCPPAIGAATRTTVFSKAPGMCIDTNKTYKAVVKTNKGSFTITLDAKKAPKTVNSFVFLARNKFYDGIVFHRIIPGFVVQGGDPKGTGQGGPGYSFVDELPKAGEYKVGSVAMANSGPNTNGSQFFIITGAQGAGLQPSYSLFGQVTSGLDVVKVLDALGSEGQGTPKERVFMQSVRIQES